MTGSNKLCVGDGMAGRRMHGAQAKSWRRLLVARRVNHQGKSLDSQGGPNRGFDVKLVGANSSRNQGFRRSDHTRRVARKPE